MDGIAIEHALEHHLVGATLMRRLWIQIRQQRESVREYNAKTMITGSFFVWSGSRTTKPISSRQSIDMEFATHNTSPPRTAVARAALSPPGALVGFWSQNRTTTCSIHLAIAGLGIISEFKSNSDIKRHFRVDSAKWFHTGYGARVLQLCIRAPWLQLCPVDRLCLSG